MKLDFEFFWPVRCYLGRLKALVCRHSVVEVVRWHRNSVPENQKDKLLYVDRHKVHNFVQCRKCRTVLGTYQIERLYEQETGL